MDTQIVNSEDVVGVSVENLQGDNLGKIEAIMLDKISSQVAYVVLSFGGFLGMGDKLFALPWHIFSYDTGREKFVISMDKEKLKQCEGFDKNHWPDMNSTSWSHTMSQYYGKGDSTRRQF